MRLLCVYANLANRKMANKVFGVGSSLFLLPFVTCAKESENQPNGFVESRRKSQPSPCQKVKAQTSASSLDNRDFKIQDATASRTRWLINGLGLERRRLSGKSKVKIPVWMQDNAAAKRSLSV